MAETKIEWTATRLPDGSLVSGYTFNPWIGCTKVSPACKNCYAERDMDIRKGRAKWGVNGTRSVTSEANWEKPLLWNKKAKEEGVRRKVFCASLADIFEDWRGDMVDHHGNVTGETMQYYRYKLYILAEHTPWLDWLFLTKRIENVEDMVPGGWPRRWNVETTWWPNNVWIGTTIEDQECADKRLPHLAKLPAPVRFVSCEPVFELIYLEEHIDSIDWIIAGGESGPGARPTHPEWIRYLRDQAIGHDVPFLFKQWGEYHPLELDQSSVTEWGNCVWLNMMGGRYSTTREMLKKRMALGGWFDFGGFTIAERVGKKEAGRMLDGREWTEFPEGAGKQ